MKIYKFCILSLLVIFTTGLSAQKTTWANKMMSGDYTFKEVQDQFYKDWEGIEYSKGHGWKQFKRWEWFWQSRLMSDGSFPSYNAGYKSYKQFMSSKEITKSFTNDWSPVGPTNYVVSSSWSPGLGRVNFVLEDPNQPSTLYVATPGGGAWKSIDNGQSWSPISDDLSFIGVSALGISSANSQIIYMATGDSDGGDTPSIGIVKSINGGDTWSIVADTMTVAGQLADIIVDPTDDNVVYVASKNRGVYKTTDGGNNWTLLKTGTYRDIEFKPGNSQVIYAAGESDIQVTTNGGASWSMAMGIPSGMSRIVLGVTPADDSYVYALVADEENKFNGLYRSTNSGSTFSARNTTTDIFDESDQAWFDLALAVSDTNKDLVFTGVLNVWRSTDGGTTLQGINDWAEPTQASYTHADIHFLRYYNNKLYCGSDGGIYRSTDNGTSFSDLTRGMQIGQFYRISGVESNSQILAGGLQDNGNYIKTGSDWKVWLGADGMENAINPNNTMEAYGMIQNGGLQKTSDGGQTAEDVSDENLEGEWVTPMVYDATANRVLAGYDKIYQYNGTWTALSNFDFGGNLNGLEMAPSNNQIIYVSLWDKLFRTTNNGSTMTEISSGLSAINTFELMITSIEVHDTDPSKVWVTFGGWEDGVKIAYSSDSGATWTNVSGTLPNLPCNIVKVDDSSMNNNAIYVGMDVGVYYKDDTMTDFIPYMANLPKVKVLDIELNKANDLVRAGTYGRGIWESATFGSTTVAVEMASLDASLQNGIVDIKWTTRSEINNDYFIVQKSTDGTVWTEIDEVRSVGNSSTLQGYHSTDDQPDFGVNYYRIVDVDTEGNMQYSDVVSVNLAEIQLTQIYPNPSAGKFTLFLEAAKSNSIELLVYNTSGVLVKSELQTIRKGLNQISLDINEHPGIYFLSIMMDGLDVYRRKKLIVK